MTKQLVFSLLGQRLLNEVQKIGGGIEDIQRLLEPEHAYLLGEFAVATRSTGTFECEIDYSVPEDKIIEEAVNEGIYDCVAPKTRKRISLEGMKQIIERRGVTHDF